MLIVSLVSDFSLSSIQTIDHSGSQPRCEMSDLCLINCMLDLKFNLLDGRGLIALCGVDPLEGLLHSLQLFVHLSADVADA